MAECDCKELDPRFTVPVIRHSLECFKRRHVRRLIAEDDADHMDVWNEIARDIKAKAKQACEAESGMDLHTIDGGLLGPAVDEQKAFDEDHRRMTEVLETW